jgi:hypothetical protein
VVVVVLEDSATASSQAEGDNQAVSADTRSRAASPDNSGAAVRASHEVRTAEAAPNGKRAVWKEEVEEHQGVDIDGVGRRRVAADKKGTEMSFAVDLDTAVAVAVGDGNSSPTMMVAGVQSQMTLNEKQVGAEQTAMEPAFEMVAAAEQSRKRLDGIGTAVEGGKIRRPVASGAEGQQNNHPERMVQEGRIVSCDGVLVQVDLPRIPRKKADPDYEWRISSLPKITQRTSLCGAQEASPRSQTRRAPHE